VLYTNDFLAFLQRYSPDFNWKLVVGSTVNCVDALITPPSSSKEGERLYAKDRPFIIDESVFISQIKLISVFAELI